MNKEDLININGIREDLYQAIQIGDITLSSKHSQELYDFMNYQDREIERLNNIINELEKYINETKLEEFEKEYGRRYGKTFTQAEVIICNMILNKLQELKGSNEPSFEEMVGFVENVYKDIKSQSTLHEELEEERKTIAKIVGDFEEVNK